MSTGNVALGIAIRLDPNKITDGLAHADMGNAVHDKIILSIMSDLTHYTKSDGRRIVNPRVRLRVDPRRIMFDLVGDLEENDQALLWMNNNFNAATFRNHMSDAIHKQITNWARQKYGSTVFADQSHVWVEQES